MDGFSSPEKAALVYLNFIFNLSCYKQAQAGFKRRARVESASWVEDRREPPPRLLSPQEGYEGHGDSDTNVS